MGLAVAGSQDQTVYGIAGADGRVSDASDTVDALQELARGTPMALRLKRVSNALENFDFDKALQALVATRELS